MAGPVCMAVQKNRCSIRAYHIQLWIFQIGVLMICVLCWKFHASFVAFMFSNFVELYVFIVNSWSNIWNTKLFQARCFLFMDVLYVFYTLPSFMIKYLYLYENAKLTSLWKLVVDRTKAKEVLRYSVQTICIHLNFVCFNVILNVALFHVLRLLHL